MNSQTPSVELSLKEIRMLESGIRTKLKKMRAGSETFWKRYTRESPQGQRYVERIYLMTRLIEKLEKLAEVDVKPLEKYQSMTYQFPGCPRQ